MLPLVTLNAHFQHLPAPLGPPSPVPHSFALCPVRRQPFIPASLWGPGRVSMATQRVSVSEGGLTDGDFLFQLHDTSTKRAVLKECRGERRWGGEGHRGSGIEVSAICTALPVFDKGRWEGAWWICRVPHCLCVGNIHLSFRACWNTKEQQGCTTRGESELLLETHTDLFPPLPFPSRLFISILVFYFYPCHLVLYLFLFFLLLSFSSPSPLFFSLAWAIASSALWELTHNRSSYQL